MSQHKYYGHLGHNHHLEHKTEVATGREWIECTICGKT